MFMLLALAAATPTPVRPERQALATVRIVRPATIELGRQASEDGRRLIARDTRLTTAGGPQRARLIEFP